MTQPIGECYPFATQMAKEAVLHDYEDFKVVHGTIHDRWSGDVYQHAWVEWEGKAYDWQTKETKPDGIPLDVYYENFQPTDTTSYTASEAVREAIRCRHHGPWDNPKKPDRLVAAVQFSREHFDEESAKLWVQTHYQRVYKVKFFPKSILILTRPVSDFLPESFKSRHVEPGVTVRSGLSNKQKNPDEGDDSEEEAIEDEDVEIAISEALEDRYDDMLAELKDSDGEIAEELFSAFEEQYFGEQDTSELYELIDDSGDFSQEAADYWDNLDREEAELLLLEAGPSLYEIKYENDINRKRRGILKKWTDDEMRTSVIDPPQDYIPLAALGLDEGIEKEASMWSDFDLQRIIGMGSSFINTDVQGGVFYGEVELPGYFYVVLRQEEFENLLLGKLTEPVKEDIVYEYADGFYVAKLTTAKQLRDEGRKLGHCIGRERYIKQAKLGDREFYSLRTTGGKSKFTIEIVPKRKRDATYPVKQIKGKNNRLPGLTHTQSEKLAYEPGHLVKIALAINKGILSEDTPLPIYLRQGPMFSIWEADTEGHPDEDKGLAITDDLVEQFLEMFDGGFKPTEVYLIAEFLVDYLNINENGNYFGGNDFYRQWAWVNWNDIPRPNPMGCELDEEGDLEDNPDNWDEGFNEGWEQGVGEGYEVGYEDCLERTDDKKKQRKRARTDRMKRLKERAGERKPRFKPGKGAFVRDKKYLKAHGIAELPPPGEWGLPRSEPRKPPKKRTTNPSCDIDYEDGYEDEYEDEEVAYE